jgi:hypothetical protein
MKLLVRFEVLTAVKMMILLFWVVTPCRLVGLKMETVCFSETLASTDESTRRQNPEQHRHYGDPYYRILSIVLLMLCLGCKNSRRHFVPECCQHLFSF